MKEGNCTERGDDDATRFTSAVLNWWVESQKWVAELFLLGPAHVFKGVFKIHTCIYRENAGHLFCKTLNSIIYLVDLIGSGQRSYFCGINLGGGFMRKKTGVWVLILHQPLTSRASLMKKMGVLFPVRSQLPSSV